MVTMPCTGQSEARGRNRWFHLAEAERTLFHHGHADEGGSVWTCSHTGAAAVPR